MIEQATQGRGDHDVFTAFYEAHVRELYRYFYRATSGDARRAEDLTQETFVAAVRAFNGGQADAVTMPWLMGVARHKLVDDHRRRSREDRKVRRLAEHTSASAELNDSVFDTINDREAISLLGGLTDMHRLVLVLRYLDGLAVAEVAAAIGRSVGATESILIRARQSLHRSLEELRSVG
jgi:RNA polymerase sigma-70 factor (ECF subfamily)